MDAIASLDPLFVWGLFTRGLGLVYLVSFVSLATQIAELAGPGSAMPVGRRLDKFREDFPTWRRFLWFPTALWVSASGAMLRTIAYIGIVASALVILGGPHSFAALLVCYLCYLSLDLPAGLVFPWDSLLFECTVLALFLPATHPLPDVRAVAAPAPALAWAYRLLLFRLMFGFGKQKFVGSRPKDLAYLKGFLVGQPLPSPLGWYAHKLPMALLRPAVLFMFIVEVPGPFLAFFPGWPSIACAAMTAALMVGIQVMGSFGYFSLVTCVLCIPLFDGATPRALGWGAMWEAGAPVVTNAFVLAHTFAALMAFPFNSWAGQSWHQWAFWYQLPRWAQFPLQIIRLLHPFRWVHPYGVFPPNNWPGAKMSLLFEVTWDRKTWHELGYQFSPSSPSSPPKFVAPHHPRGDQAIIYDTLGLNPVSLISSILGPWEPYPFGSRAPATTFCQYLLTIRGHAFLKGSENDPKGEPPVSVRVTTIMLEPVSLEEHRKTGNWWKRTYVGPHVAPQERDPDFFKYAIGEPELWHPDAIFWRRRSRLRPLMERALAGDDPMTLAARDAGEMTPEDAERFWTEFVPLFAAPTNETFDTLPEVAAEVRRRFDRRTQRAYQRLVGRFSLFLVARLEPLYLGHGLKPKIPVNTYFQLWMLAAHVIAKGKDAYMAAYRDPPSVVAHVADLTTQRGLYPMSIFRLEEMTFEAQKLRLLTAYTFPFDEKEKAILAEKVRGRGLESAPAGERLFVRLALTVSGFFNVLPDIRDNFKGPKFHLGFPEHYPTFVELESGAVVVGKYFDPAEEPRAE